jgi:hypothetical protein
LNFATISNISALQLNPMKHKIVIEIPPYYIDTLQMTTSTEKKAVPLLSTICLNAIM